MWLQPLLTRDWQVPVATHSARGKPLSVELRFPIALARMRGCEWADDVWVRSIAPAALGFQITVLSTLGAAYDLPAQPLLPWMLNFHVSQRRHLVVCHLVVGGRPLHYVAVCSCDHGLIQEDSTGFDVRIAWEKRTLRQEIHQLVSVAQ